ncbi:MEDS domain-containing protein [Saccharothrix variisporea]|uniref:DcmR-like sensory protein n=1 Tax=Saccharothrix variisporea TaxID=543527 RepID=A0A495X384_9PSEU|nr:MEDS domain-containing protein [Saccharothrix variisporea]RKT67053.1 DcmR-like sensory protein [Saccharothrix variisporea]
MRRSGSVRDARDLGRHDHLCWSYDETPDFLARVREYLAEGLQLGQRVRFAALGASPDALAGLPGIDAALASGAAEVTPLSDTYSGDPEDQVRAYADATEKALADGYTGLRVAAEATPLVSTPPRLTAFLRYEHLVDRYMARRPFSAMCGYNATVLDEHTVTQLAGVHPCTNLPVPFRLHAAPGGEVVELGGEVDASGHDLLASLLERIDVDGDLVVHAPDLAFIDHRGLLLLADAAGRHAGSLVLRTRAAGAARLVELLDIPDVRVEEIP